MLADIRYAVRRLWHSKGFATVAVLCLGFGIGLNTTIFSVMDGVLLKPYPYPDPDRILVLGEQNQKSGGQAGLSYLDMRDWNASNTSWKTIAAVSARSLTVADGGHEPDRYLGAGVSWDLFPLLGAQPILGHGFTAADDQPNSPGVVLLSYALWTLRYQSDPGIVGRSVSINGKPFVVAGVMPPKFEFPNTQKLWIPLTPLVAQDPRGARGLLAFGRIRPGVAQDAALGELRALSATLARTYPDTNENWTLRVRTLREAFLPEEVPRVIYLMMAGVTLVLFIACSNVANLLLARATGRRREISVRTALGAGRRRIVRQLVTESVVLGVVSLPVGILLAEAGTRLIASAMPPDQVPYYITWAVDWRSLVYTVVVAVTTALVFGLFPALQVSRGNLHEHLKEGTRGNTAARSLLRSTLVVAQVSLALVALVGALLFVRTFSNLDAFQLGFDPAPMLTMRVYLSGDAYEVADARAQRVDDITRRLEALPGVRAVFGSNMIPISGGGGGGTVVIEGRPAEVGRSADITFTGVTPHFYQTLGVGLLEGRSFTDTEGATRSQVAIVTQAMAKRFWPDADAIGHRFRLQDAAPDAAGWFTVIGVAPDLKLDGINPGNDEPLYAAFVPYIYQQALSTGFTIRVAGDPASMAAAARGAVHDADPALAVSFVRTLQDVRRLSYWEYGLYGWIFGAIGVVGLLLASLGIYGVLAYAVSQRTQEIGVRSALGASRGRIFWLVVGHGLLLVGIGVVIGLVLAPAGAYASRSLLYHVSPFDPLTFAGVSGLLLVVAVLASALPALRATRVNPVVALRGE